jgi:UDP:flavonoid glycosyltransferase YjiC (YdhE family)
MISLLIDLIIHAGISIVYDISDSQEVSMKITITAVGSRGDVQPHVALGRGLAEAGHQVRLAVDGLFEDLVRGNGLGFAPIEADPVTPMQEDMSKLGNNPVKIARWMANAVENIGDEYFESYLTANQDAELMICSSVAMMAGIHIAAKFNLPVISTTLQPTVPTTAYPYSAGRIFPDWLPFLGAVNRQSYIFAIRAFYRMFFQIINRNRENLLGLPALPWKMYRDIDISAYPILHGFSQYVIPYPDDYNDNQIFTGYWFLDQEMDWQPPSELESFLAAGDPPVYIGFGSVLDLKTGALNEIVLKALEISGQRAVVLGGWTDLGGKDLPETVLKLESIPHSHLFPRVSVVVHHGGAGTTGAGLRAGKPTVIVPYSSDQPFWGWRVERLGVGPKPVPRLRLTAENLAAAISAAVTDKRIRNRAAALGDKIQTEDGVGNAVQAIEEIVATKLDRIMPDESLYGK